MKKYFRMPFALAVIVLLTAIGSAQASQPKQANSTDSSGISSVFPLNRWSTDYIYTNADAGSDVSIAFDPDHDQAAWVSYYNATYGSLWVAHYVGVNAGICGPSYAWWCEQVDWIQGEVKGLSSSIDVFPDINPDPLISTWKVGISYYDATHKSLKYAQYVCPPSNPCNWTIRTVDSSSNPDDDIGRYTSLKFNSTGIPNIAYYVNWGDYITDALYRAYLVGSSNGNCSVTLDWQCDKVDQFASLGPYLSLDIDWSDNVYIAYYDGLNDHLKYAYYAGIGDCWLGNGWICQYIDATAGADVGLFPSLHAPQNSSDYLRIAYYDTTNGRLKYATGPWASGNCGPSNSFQCFYVDNMGTGLTWASISLAVDSNNKPMIAYTDAEEDLAPLGVKVTGPSSEPPWNTCDGVLPDWQCARVDNGNQYLDVGKFVALGLKDSGLVMIAYSETDTYEYPATDDLKFAYQTVWSFLPVTLK